MRIGFIIYGSLDTLTGGYLYDRIVARGLEGLGHEVEVISLPAGTYFRRLWFAFSQGLYRRLRDGSFDIIIEDELCHPSLFLVNRKLRHHPDHPLLVALVHHLLCNEPRPRWYNLFFTLVERTFLFSVDGFIHNSKTTQESVASLVAHNRPQVIAYPAGDRFGTPLSAEVISKRTQRSGPLELLFLGNIIPRKGLLPLLSALAEVDSELWRLSIVGGLDFDPAYTVRAQKLTRQLRLTGSVRFLGPLQEDDLSKIFSTSHLFCMPYAYEGFGIAILEAMAFGLPAIGCSSGAACESISHGTNGFLLDPGDLAGLEPLLQQLHRDRARLQQMAIAARETYVSRPSWQDSIAAIDTFLQKLRALPALRKGNGPARNQELQDQGIPMQQDNSPSNRKQHVVADETSKNFDPRYLAAKKSIDDRALNHHVWKMLRQALAQNTAREPVMILELGAGIGTMFERLIDRGLLTGPCTYLATDMDPEQIRAARNYLSQWAGKHGHSLSWTEDGGQLRTARADISLRLEVARAEELAQRSDSLGPFHLVLAHAVLDLVDFPPVLTPLMSRLTSNGLAYFTCNFDGETIFLPECEIEDEIIRDYHNSMEARLTGASHTGRRLLTFLQGLGLEIMAAGSSDWVIHPRKDKYSQDETFFLHAIIQTVENELARKNRSSSHRANLTTWARLRHQQVETGTLFFLARHLDLLVRQRLSLT